VRTVYLGTSDFAATVLDRLAAGDHRPVLVVTRPDRPKGRGRALHSPPVAARARIAAAEPGAVLVCAFGALIKEPLLSEHEMLNVHPSLLPRWRGAAPVERAMMAGDTETGVAIMRMTAGLDSGPVGLLEREPIAPDDTYGTLAPRLAARGGELLVRALDDSPSFTEQTEDGATYAEKIGPEDRTLDSARTPEQLDRVVRALTPHIGARIALGPDELLGVVAARPAPGEAGAGTRAGALAHAEGRLLYGCAGGALELLVVQPPGGRAMSAADYLRGHSL